MVEAGISKGDLLELNRALAPQYMDVVVAEVDGKFTVKHLSKSNGLVSLSANFTLYGDMSGRMMSIAAGLGPGQEIYSNDESFIDLTRVRGNSAGPAPASRLGCELRQGRKVF